MPQATDTKWGSSNRKNDPIRGIQQLDRSLIAMHIWGSFADLARVILRCLDRISM
ncbi:MAG: hypothetical protein VXX07_04430 [Pseudomonadota bacterium]|nr:hypothetical protein [Enterobacterales bacterium]MEC7081384.1 hypothetical protein [Pseudomonadota bacterium]MEC7511063.1 hypothetical protein [Pseudomonadota bacterium]MEC8638306.1 hypothetical protein [Pseudomonadota bacterium]MED5327233.1 hypothetical protein [Pseudomonadota bacterium]